MKIRNVHIGPYPQKLTDPMPKVHAYFDDGTEKDLFEFFPDELSFQPAEFIGLTEEQAHELKRRKDVAYLQS